jgi:Predicted ATPase
LKDLSAPEHLYQYGADSFAPLKSLYRTNLPVPTSSFLGRVSELSEIVALLGRDSARVLTLTGPGGIGKTRLAARAAGEVSQQYPDGVFWVDLAALRDPRLVVPAIATELGAKDEVVAHIGAGRMLLVLDNFEQVIDAAREARRWSLVARTLTCWLRAVNRFVSRVSESSRCRRSANVTPSRCSSNAHSRCAPTSPATAR